MKPVAENKLFNFFQNKASFSRKELFDYFRQTEDDLKEGTFGWRIYDLKKKSILHEVKRGCYTLKAKPIYAPAVSEKIKKLAAEFNADYKGAKYCLWDLNCLNEFTVHQFNQQMLLFETEKDLQESLAYNLNDKGYPILWSLKGTLLSAYEEMIIVLPLISRAPVQNIETEGEIITLPTLEKILVDIFQEKKIFHFVQGAEMERIYENALNRYSVNFTTLFGYAKRRGKENELRKFLFNQFPELFKNISQ